MVQVRWDHESATCKIKDPRKFKCANCNENHTANYQGCLAYKSIEKFLRKRKTSVLQRVQENKKSTNQSSKTETYANAVRSKNIPTSSQLITPEESSNDVIVTPRNSQIQQQKPAQSAVSSIDDIINILNKLTNEVASISRRLSNLEASSTGSTSIGRNKGARLSK